MDKTIARGADFSVSYHPAEPSPVSIEVDCFYRMPLLITAVLCTTRGVAHSGIDRNGIICTAMDYSRRFVEKGDEQNTCQSPAVGHIACRRILACHGRTRQQYDLRRADHWFSISDFNIGRIDLPNEILLFRRGRRTAS